MAQIRPFRALRYNPTVVGDLQRVVSPPYDVISPEQQSLLHLQSAYNAIRLELNQAADRYATAARTFQEWLRQNALRQEQQPALYYYTQEFRLPEGGTRLRTGVLAALRLEEFGSGRIRPHERTFEKAKADRFALLEACQAQFSPILCLYAQSSWSLAELITPGLEEPPLMSVTDQNGVTHRVWSVTESDVIASVANCLAPESLVIADGHHRYETALRYRRERGAAGGTSGEEPFQYVLAYLTNAYDPGLVILPTHRLLHDARLPRSRDLQLALRKDFGVSLFPTTDIGPLLSALRAPGGEGKIACLLAEAEHYWLLHVPDRVTRDLSLSAALRALDVTVLHDVVFQRFLGLTPELQKQLVEYTSDTNEAVVAVRERRAKAAFLLNATPFDQVERVCKDGETMPQKSTYFYPKLLTGLVFYSLTAS